VVPFFPARVGVGPAPVPTLPFRGYRCRSDTPSLEHWSPSGSHSAVPFMVKTWYFIGNVIGQTVPCLWVFLKDGVTRRPRFGRGCRFVWEDEGKQFLRGRYEAAGTPPPRIVAFFVFFFFF